MTATSVNGGIIVEAVMPPGRGATPKRQLGSSTNLQLGLYQLFILFLCA